MPDSYDLGGIGAANAHVDSVKAFDAFYLKYATANLFVSGSDDHTVKLWNLLSKSLVTTYRNHVGPIRYALSHMVVNFDSITYDTFLFTGALDGVVNSFAISTSNNLLGSYRVKNDWAVTSLRVVVSESTSLHHALTWLVCLTCGGGLMANFS